MFNWRSKKIVQVVGRKVNMEQWGLTRCIATMVMMCSYASKECRSLCFTTMKNSRKELSHLILEISCCGVCSKDVDIYACIMHGYTFGAQWSQKFEVYIYIIIRKSTWRKKVDASGAWKRDEKSHLKVRNFKLTKKWHDVELSLLRKLEVSFSLYK